MSKIQMRVSHRDQAVEDHAHRLPDGSYTTGSLYKPYKDRTFPHTHLYQHMGNTLETSLAPVGGDHTHITECGVTSGPVPVRKDSQEHVDFIQRVGSKWGVFSESGHKLGEHSTEAEAKQQLAAVEASKARQVG